MEAKPTKGKKLTLAAFVSSVLGLLGIIFIFSIIYLNFYFSRSIEKILDSETVNYTNVITGVIFDTVDRYLLLSSSLAAEPALTIALEGGEQDVSRNILTTKINFDLDEAFFLSGDGQIIFENASDLSILSNQEFLSAVSSIFDAVTARALIIDSDVYQFPVLYVITPIIGAQQNGLVILGKVLDDNYLNLLDPASNRGLFIVNKDGVINASSGYSKENLNFLLSSFIGEELKNNPDIQLSRIYQTELFSGAIALSNLRYNGFPLALFGFYLDGADFFTIRSFLYTLNFYIMIGILTLFIITLLMLQRSVIRPITLIDLGLAKLSGGDFDIKMKELGLKEIAGIAAGFNVTVAQLKKLNDAKTGFISVASHQLRTPLTSMRWFSELLLGEDAGKINEQQQKFVERIHDGTERMTALVNLLLQIARVEAGRVRITPAPVDLKVASEEIVLTLKKLFDDKKQKVVVTTKPEPFPPVAVDKEVVWQVILNLLTNANRYSPVEGTIAVAIVQKDKTIEYSVTDQGIGIPESAKSRIFEKFFRAENALKAVPEGTGLGLNLVKLLVEGWGGQIWFESEVGKGTTFYFTIPLAGMKAKEGEVTIRV
jgi:signal transduction histidine kinase